MPAVPSPFTAPPSRVTSTLHQGPRGRPLSAYAPVAPHGPHAPWPLRLREVAASAAALAAEVALQLEKQIRSAEAVLPRTQRPMPYIEEGNQASARHKQKGEESHHNSKDLPLQFKHGYAPNSTKLPVKAALQPLQQKWAAEAVRCTVERNPAAVEHKEEEHYQKFEEDRCVSNSRLPVVISNPVEGDILESVASFATKKADKLDIIRDALMALPKGPRSMLCQDCFAGGGDCGGDGTSDSTSSHTNGRVPGCTTSVEKITFDAGPDLVRFGFVKSDKWKTVWEQQPLILHDADIVRAAKGIGGQIDVLQIITSVLKNHPGPVRYFRVDSTQILKGREQLEDWIDLLKKEAEEIVIVNSRWPNDIIDFPINDLDFESLRRLRLCFFKISDINLNYIQNLTAIDLSCCSISTQELYALVDQSKSLKELDIGLTESDVIKINSQSLEILLIWHSVVQRVSVQSAPKLRRVLVAARPRKPSSHLSVWIDGAPRLTDVWFNLSKQSVTINNICSMTDIDPLPSIRRLVLNISFLVKKERSTLLNLVKSCTTLKELTVWRNDEVSDAECFDALVDDWPSSFKDLSCLKYHLEVFSIKDFKGGDSEIAIAAAVLENASCLQQLTLESYVNCHDDAVFNRAKVDLQMIVQASVGVCELCYRAE